MVQKRLSRHRASIAPSLWNVGWIGVRVHETTEQVIAVAVEAVQHFDELAANEPGAQLLQSRSGCTNLPR